MMVSLFGLSPGGINLMNLSTELVQLVLSHLFIPSLDVSFLFMCACAHDMIFNACLWFRFIDTRVLIFARHLAFATPLAREFWLPWILMFRSWNLKLVHSPGYWSEIRSGDMDHRQTVRNPILTGSLLISRVFPLVTRECLLYCSYLYISLKSRICAY